MQNSISPYKFSLFLLLVALIAAVGPAISSEQPTRVSGPHLHDNLSIYFVHGPSVEGPVPLTLEEAMKTGGIRVHETGSVQQLFVENLSDKEIFIQAGDIVKGGKQDRVLTMSIVLPPKPGRVSIAAYCVEAGRWSGRGTESTKQFASSSRSVPSRKLKLALRAPIIDQRLETVPGYGSSLTVAPRRIQSNQQQVWARVAESQTNLSKNVGDKVAAVHSPSSLQLALENKKLRKIVTKYIRALEGTAGKQNDIIGFAFAINGKLNSADVYPSNGLFRKMWTKLLRASVTEAIAERHNRNKETAPTPAQISTFIDRKGREKISKTKLVSGQWLETRKADDVISFVSRRKNGRTIHLNLLAND